MEPADSLHLWVKGGLKQAAGVCSLEFVQDSLHLWVKGGLKRSDKLRAVKVSAGFPSPLGEGRIETILLG